MVCCVVLFCLDVCVVMFDICGVVGVIHVRVAFVVLCRCVCYVVCVVFAVMCMRVYVIHVLFVLLCRGV